MTTVIQLQDIPIDVTQTLPTTSSSRSQFETLPQTSSSSNPRVLKGMLGRIVQLWTLATAEITDEDIRQAEIIQDSEKREEETPPEDKKEKIYLDPLELVPEFYWDDLTEFEDDLNSHYLVMHLYAIGELRNLNPLKRINGLVSKAYRITEESRGYVESSKGGRMMVGESIVPWPPEPQENPKDEIVEGTSEDGEAVVVSFSEPHYDDTLVSNLTLEMTNLTRDVEMEIRVQMGGVTLVHRSLVMALRSFSIKFSHPWGMMSLVLIRSTNWSKYVQYADEDWVFVHRTFRSLILLSYLTTYSDVKLPNLSEFDMVTAVKLSRKSWDRIMAVVDDIKNNNTLSKLTISTNFFWPSEKDEEVSFNFQIHAVSV